MTKEEIEKFNLRWKKVDECHIWQNRLDKDGYGMFHFRKKTRRAHRVGFFSQNGPIGDDMVIDHICRNRSCVNPDHLRAVTASTNATENTRSVAAINRAKTLCKNGHPFDKKYMHRKSGRYQRYCSICEREKSKRLHRAWREEAAKTKC